MFHAECQKIIDAKNIIYEEIDIEENEISRDKLYDITGGRTVPQIIINENIGGYRNLFHLNQSGELDNLLKVS